MRNKKLQNQVTAGRLTLPVVVLICTLCWVSTYFLFPDLITAATQESFSSFWQSARDFLFADWTERIVSFFVYAIIGYFLIELNNQFGIIRMRASMQTAIYFLLVTACPEMHLLYAGDIAALAFLISIYFLFKSLSAITLGRLSVLFLPLYRGGKHPFPPAHRFIGALAARSLPVSGTYTTQLLRRAGRMDTPLLDAVRTRLLLQ